MNVFAGEVDSAEENYVVEALDDSYCIYTDSFYGTVKYDNTEVYTVDVGTISVMYQYVDGISADVVSGYISDVIIYKNGVSHSFSFGEKNITGNNSVIYWEAQVSNGHVLRLSFSVNEYGEISVWLSKR